MRIHKHTLQTVAVLLIVLMVGYTMPVSAAEVARAASIGSVSVVGAVDLRGVRINGDGTLFSGDRMNVAPGAYAKVALGTGPKLEVGSGSDVTVTRDADKTQVQMASGNVAFKGDGKAPILVRIGAYELTVPGNASGNVAFIGKEAFGVRVLTGSVSGRNVETKQSFTVQKGTEQIVSLSTGAVSPAMAKLASTSAAAVPAMPQPRQANTGLSKAGWIAVLGTVAGAATAIIVLATRNDDEDGDAAKRLAQVTALQNLAAIKSTATASASLAATVTTSATQALAAINAAPSSIPNKGALVTAANAIISKANSASTRVTNLTADITALENEIANQDGGPTSQQQAELNQLLADLETARNEANSALSDLNSLLNSASNSGVGNLPPPPGNQPVPPPTTSSPSNP